MAIDPTRDPHAHIVTKPLPSRVRKGEGAGSPGCGSGGAPARQGSASAAGRPDAQGGRAVSSPDPFLRAENEDDDGYDPYSDRPAPREPLFQEDPWS